MPPDINAGRAEFGGGRADGKIEFGLLAIKGVGLKAIEAIVEGAARQHGPFTSLTDLFERVPSGVVGAACVEALIKAGAFDKLGGHRAQWLAVLPRAVKDGQATQSTRKRGQVDMFAPVRPDRRARRANGTARAIRPRPCPTSPPCPTPSGWPRRRRSSAST